MGRIRTTLIKRTAHELIELHRDQFTDNFEENKAVVNNLISTSSRVLRNKIAGYVTKLMKKKEEEETY